MGAFSFDLSPHPTAPPQGWDRLCLGRLSRERYASCGFPQEDYLVPFLISENPREIKLFGRVSSYGK